MKDNIKLHGELTINDINYLRQVNADIIPNGEIYCDKLAEFIYNTKQEDPEIIHEDLCDLIMYEVMQITNQIFSNPDIKNKVYVEGGIYWYIMHNKRCIEIRWKYDINDIMEVSKYTFLHIPTLTKPLSEYN